MKKAKFAVFSLLLLAFVLVAATGVSELWPGLFNDRNPAPGVHSDDAVPATAGANDVLPEPAAILLLGAGLVSLGLYAKQKHRRHQ